jgi:hypothetical protein
MELVTVVLIIGLLGTMAVTRYGSSLIGDVSADGFARRLSLDCLQARRRAISTGVNHLLRFTLDGGDATQYVLYRREGAGVVQEDDVRLVPSDVTVATGGTVDMEFTFTGETLAAYTITITAPDRALTVTVPQLTGTAFVQ